MSCQRPGDGYEGRALLRGRSTAPRDWLYAYMRHWLAAFLDLERPDLYQCLPEDFNLGHPLPPSPQPRIRRKGFAPRPLPEPRPWDARRVLAQRRWAWLRDSGECQSHGWSKIATFSARGPL